MKIEQKKWTSSSGWEGINRLEGNPVHLVLAFGDRFLLEDEKRFNELKSFYPHAQIILASTSGNIINSLVEDQLLTSTAIAFEKSSSIEVIKGNIKLFKNSFEAGKILGSKLNQNELKHVMLFSDGHIVNGSELVNGILTSLPKTIAVTGGLAGDGTRFEKTILGVNEAPKEGEIAVIGFYGKHLKFGFGSVGGWDPFGMERVITKSSNNILYELDGKSALDLYKSYLGDQAKELPGSALLFPLAIRSPDGKSSSLVRTILSIDEKNKAMIFAGDLPEGWYAQLMKANFDRLIDGASQAANSCHEMLGEQPADLAILISCVGRRIVLDQRTEDEIESVIDVIGRKIPITGFYSYGEIAPTAKNAGCDLHNQTMTITTIAEREQ